MCVAKHRYGPIGGDYQDLTEDQLKGVKEFDEARRKQLEAEPLRGLRGVPSSGWSCPNCGGAHGPHVSTCPEPPKGGSLRERLKAAQ
jgi:hypothetical protein